MAKYNYVTPENPFGFHTQEIDISKIKPHPKNPRTIDPRDRIHLSKSIEKFGLIDKPILNNYEANAGEVYDWITVAGHQRIDLYRSKGKKTIMCEVPEIPMKEEEVEELLIRHNKNTGKFDNSKLVLFDAKKLINFGFLDSELPKAVEKDLDKVVTDPVFPITPKFSEKHGYVLIMFDNELDKANLETMLGLEKVQDYKTQRIATGRVLTFEQFKNKWDGRKK